MTTLFYNARLVDAFCDNDGAILVEDGFIKNVFMGFLLPSVLNTLFKEKSEVEMVDCKGLVLMPSFVDMHAHFRYPGQPQKEELETALKAAVAGGFGTLMLMPNTNPVVSSAEEARFVQLQAAQLKLADVVQSISITRGFDGTNTEHLTRLDSSLHPVISEDGHDVNAASVMLAAMKKCAKNNLLVSCHCEDFSFAEAARVPRGDVVTLLKQDEVALQNGADEAGHAERFAKIDAYMKKAEQLLAAAEDIATIRNLYLSEIAGCNIHIAHVSTAASLEAVEQAKQKRGSAVSCEVTPHHIALSGSMVEFVNPPIRPEKDRLALIEGIKRGVVDCIATDHAPHSKDEKKRGACGFSGLETAFAVCYDELVLKKHISLNKLSALMSANPAKRLGTNCGILRPGRQADFVLIDLNKKWKVDSENFYSKGKHSPFNGLTLQGKIMQTIRRGKVVFSAGDLQLNHPEDDEAVLQE
ncbi:MAG: dihydroorotase [Treponemataceae bacterium]|nr:dihydroorotase [Treponemataceae bacterium]